MKWYGKYRRKASWIVKRYNKYEETWVKEWDDMDNMKERQVELWNDLENMGEKYVK